MFAGVGGHAGRLKMHVVGRCVDDCLDRFVIEDVFVAIGCPAAVFRRECPPLVFGAREATDDLDVLGALGGVGQDVRSPAHPQCRHPQRSQVH